jgi:hypothetical protein
LEVIKGGLCHGRVFNNNRATDLKAVDHILLSPV